MDTPSLLDTVVFKAGTSATSVGSFVSPVDVIVSLMGAAVLSVGANLSSVSATVSSLGAHGFELYTPESKATIG